MYAEKLKNQVAKEALVPPPLKDNLANDLYKYLVDLINSKTQTVMQKELHDIAVKCLFQLSATNCAAVIKNITPNLTSQALTEEEIQTHISLLEYLNHNDKSLGMMIQMIGKALNGQKKSNIQVAMAKVLRSIIWSWIDNFPWQFISLCHSGQRLGG